MSVHVGASWWIRLNDQWRWKCGSLSTLCSRHFSFTASIQTWHSFEVCAQKYLVPCPVSCCADKTLTSFRSLRIMTCVLLCRQDIDLVPVPSCHDLCPVAQTGHWPCSGPFVSWPVSCRVDRTLTLFRSLRIMTCVVSCRQDIDLVPVPSYHDLCPVVQTRHWPRSGPFVSWPVSCRVDRTLTSFRSLRVMTYVLLCRQDIDFVLVHSYYDLCPIV